MKTKCTVTNKLYADKISYAKEKAWGYLNRSIMTFNHGNCIKADYKKSKDFLNLAYENLADALRQELLSNTTMRERNNEKWNNLYWTAPHYVHQWNKKCTDLYIEQYSNYVELILNLKERKSDMKSIWESK